MKISELIYIDKGVTNRGIIHIWQAIDYISDISDIKDIDAESETFLVRNILKDDPSAKSIFINVTDYPRIECGVDVLAGNEINIIFVNGTFTNIKQINKLP